MRAWLRLPNGAEVSGFSDMAFVVADFAPTETKDAVYLTMWVEGHKVLCTCRDLYALGAEYVGAGVGGGVCWSYMASRDGGR